ncbi:MAG TPA: phosphate ABC transporter substrate-binding protein [Anaeromyxobacter sp.]|nr:phosphate ABC transporter substrate-binding protein [Anaeromyxobacter sp.]
MRVLVHALLCALALAGVGCRGDAPKAPARIRYDGATTISNLVLPQLLPVLKERSGIEVEVGRSGAGRGLARLLGGEVDVAGVSRALTREEIEKHPYFQIVGYDALGVFVNAGNPVKALTRAQLKALFTGKIASWKELGGHDLPVQPCVEHVRSGRATVEGFRTLALDEAAYGPVQEEEDPADCLAFVAAHPGAITPATMTYANLGVHTVAIDGLEPIPQNVRSSRYLLTRPLLLVTKEPPAGPVRELFDLLLSPEGQEIVARAGFVPAR